jgi:hypothetical protein
VRSHAGDKRRGPAPGLRELKHSQLYAEELGIDLASGREQDYFCWFLASLLYGGRISETIARRTYQSFCRHGLTSPRRVVAAGWDFLVNPVMREGGYVRYDGRKSEQILRDCATLLMRYGGRLSQLHQAARNPRDLEARLDAFYGVGPVTANIFLRELRPFWSKADPKPLPSVVAQAKTLGIAVGRQPRKTLGFARMEAGLIRLAHRQRRGRTAIRRHAAISEEVAAAEAGPRR